MKIQPEAQGVNVRDKFIEFHAKHYSANKMKLVVLGREPLDVLETWVAESFSGIENKHLPPNRWLDEVPFRPSDLGVQCFAKPVMDSRELNLFFPFLDEEELFKTQPSRYVSHLIGHEGPGSIMSYIKGKGWANGLSAGTYPVCPGTPGIFNCQIRLTEEVGSPPRQLCNNELLTSPAVGIEKLPRDRQGLLPIYFTSEGNPSPRMDIR